MPDFGQTGALARILRRLTRGMAGLSQFKSAFAPTWEVRYAAAPGRLALLAGGLEVAAAILWPGKLGAGRARLVVLQGGGAAKDDLWRNERAA